MKLKNASFVQLHIEKIVIGVAVLISLVLVLLFVLNRPKVTIGSQKVGPSEVDEAVNEYAQQLKRELDANRGLDGPLSAPAFHQQYEGMVDAVAVLTPADGASFSVPTNVIQAEVPTVAYALQTPPVPTQDGAIYNTGVLGLYEEPETEASFVSLYGFVDGQPRDVAGVTVAGEFDSGQLRQQLETLGKRRNVPEMPVGMLLKSERIAGVYLIRERMTGMNQWGELTVVEPAPGQLAYGRQELMYELGLVDSPIDPTITQMPDADARQLMSELAGTQEFVTQPPVPVLDKGVWRVPGQEGVKQLTAEDYQQIDKLRDDVLSKQKLVENYTRQLENWQRANQARGNNNRSNNTTRRRPAGGGGIDGPGGLDELGGGGLGGGAAARPRPQRSASDRGQELTQRIQDAELEIQEKVQEVAILMGWIEEQSLDATNNSFQAAGGRSGVTRPGVRPGATTVVMTADQAAAEDKIIPIQAHDMTVVPGNVYRYKLVAIPANPLFLEVRVVESQREANYHKIGLPPSKEDIDKMSWSDPVVVDAQDYFFLVNGSVSQQEAQFEVWRYYDGQWRLGELDASQGDQLAGTIRYTEPGQINPQTGEQIQIAHELDVNTGMIFLEIEDITLPSTGRQVSTALYLEPKAGDLAIRSMEEDRQAFARQKLRSLQWIASEPLLIEAEAGTLRRSGPGGGMSPFDNPYGGGIPDGPDDLFF